MKPNRTSIMREITLLSQKDCFYIADRTKREFTYPIHSHKECELNFVSHATGVRRIVGDSIEVIGDFDLVLITGEDVEHVWEQYECRSPLIREVTIQFAADLFSVNFIEKIQFNSIRQMLEKAQRGLCFPKEAVLKIYTTLTNLSKKEGFYAVLDFLTLLYELSLFADKARVLSSSSFAKINVRTNSRRIQKVQEYIDERYKEDIRLADVANLVKMTPMAFSRFFKLRTGRNPTDYIIDVRMGHVARLLVDSTMSVAEIGYACGFNNISNLNRLFKRRKDISPTEFRKHYRKKKMLI